MLIKTRKVKKQGPGYHKPTIPYFDTKFRPEVVAIDTETTGLKWSNNDRLFAISAAWYDSNNKLITAYWDFPVNPYTRLPIIENRNGLNLLNSYYGDPSIKIVMANSKFDRHMLSHVGLSRLDGNNNYGRIDDVLIAAWCCNTMEKGYGLNYLSERYLDVNQDDAKELKEQLPKLRSKAKKDGLNAGPGLSTPYQDYWLLKYYNHNSKICEKYAIKDAGERTLNLWYYYEQALAELKCKKAYEIEIALSTSLFRMEKRGIRFFEHTCVEELDVLRQKVVKAQLPIIDRFGLEVNLDSPKQLSKCLFDMKDKHSNSLDLPIIERSDKTKEPSCSAPTFEKLLPYDDSGILQNLLEYKGFKTGEKTCKRYINLAVKDKALTTQDILHLHNHKAMHCNFNQISSQYDRDNGTRTGRLSSSNDNLQNVRDEEKSQSKYGTDARTFFGPRNGYMWYCIDYSQLELRIFAERLGSKSSLYKAFMDGKDPHNHTREVIPYLAAMDEPLGRKIAKNFNFGVINGAGINVFNKKYNMPVQQAKEGLEGFYASYPETKTRQKEAQAYAIKHGYIKTLFGRKINVDLSRYSRKEANKLGKDHWAGRYKYAYRASAYDIQGSAADIIKRSMIEFEEWRKDYPPSKLDVHLLLSVHDELVFEVWKKHCFKWFLRSTKLIMENMAQGVMKIPLEVEIKKTTKTWSSKHLQKVVL